MCMASHEVCMESTEGCISSAQAVWNHISNVYGISESCMYCQSFHHPRWSPPLAEAATLLSLCDISPHRGIALCTREAKREACMESHLRCVWHHAKRAYHHTNVCISSMQRIVYHHAQRVYHQPKVAFLHHGFPLESVTITSFSASCSLARLLIFSAERFTAASKNSSVSKLLISSLFPLFHERITA